MNRLSIVVKGLCNLKGLKMRELAEKMGISSTSLSQLLSRDNPQRPTLRKFAAAFEMKEDDFTELYLNDDSFSPHFIATGSAGRAVSQNTVSIGNSISELQPVPDESIKRVADKPKRKEQRITAIIDFERQSLYAQSFEELRTITNIIDVLRTLGKAGDKETYSYINNVLVGRFGKETI